MLIRFMIFARHQNERTTARTPGRRGIRSLTACLLLVVISCGPGLTGDAAWAQQDPDDVALIDRDPFDRIYFDDQSVHDVDPLQVDGYTSTMPIDPREMSGRVIFTSPEYTGRIFDVQWSRIDKVERYAELVLSEARQAMATNDYPTAFKTLMFLESNPETRNSIELRQMMDQCLYGDAQANLQDGNYSAALTAFESLQERNPRYNPGSGGTPLANIKRCYDEFVRQQVEAGNFQHARDLLTEIDSRYGAELRDVVESWRADMTRRALVELERVEELLADDEGFLAHESARRLMFVNPDLPESARTFEQVVSRFPYVYVGVAQPAQEKNVRRIDNWASRRVGSLTRRWLMEYSGPGDEGGKYDFPSGRFQRTDDVGLEYEFQIQSRSDSQTPPITSFEISNRLLDLADPSSEDYYVPWARIAESVEIVDENRVAFKLRYPHVRPEALLPLPYYSADDERSQQDNGLYVTTSENDRDTVFDFNAAYARPQDRQTPLVVERLFAKTSDATEALLRGELDVVDRVFPADIRRLARNPMIDVRPYVVPTVHLLIPNPRNDYMRNDDFRRALLYGINRPLILREIVGGGQDMEGFQLVSGPFAPGTEVADQFAYAYDFGIKPRDSNGHLAIVLTEQFKIMEVLRRERAGEEDVRIETPQVVLAHPDDDLTASICEAIAQHWRAVGIETTLRALPPGVSRPDDDDYDLLFVELQMQEPMVDAYRLFGRGGLVKLVDPTIKQALRQLDVAYSWAEASSALRRVHRQSFNNMSVLPLWQIVEHCAYRRNVFNIGDQLVYLYQNIDRWRVSGELQQVSQK